MVAGLSSKAIVFSPATAQPSWFLMADEIRSFALLESFSESIKVLAESAINTLETGSVRTNMRSAIALRRNLRHIPHIKICNRSSIRSRKVVLRSSESDISLVMSLQLKI